MKNYLLFPLLLLSLSVLGQQRLCEECNFLYSNVTMREYIQKCTVDDTSVLNEMYYRVIKKYLCEKMVIYFTYKKNDTIPVVGFFISDNLDTIYTKVDKSPEFKGGNTELEKFIARNIVYPWDAQRKGIQGKVYVEFVVRKNGAVEAVKLRKGIEVSLNEEAIRVIKLMPKWKPGEYNGKPVDFISIIPINYRLPE